jgi:hypothetical protein
MDYGVYSLLLIVMCCAIVFLFSANYPNYIKWILLYFQLRSSVHVRKYKLSNFVLHQLSDADCALHQQPQKL